MHTSLFIKCISYVLLLSFFNGIAVESVYAGGARDKRGFGEADTGEETRGLLPGRSSSGSVQADDDTFSAFSVPIPSKVTLLDLVQNDAKATEELRRFVQSLSPRLGGDLRTFGDVERYAAHLGPTGTNVKWVLAVINGGLQAAGTSALFVGTPGIGGLLHALPSPEEPYTPIPKLVGLSALAGIFTLPDTILGTENALLALRHAVQDKNLLKYIQKKGPTHIIIRGVADAVGTAFFVLMTIKAFLDTLQGATVGPGLLFFLGTELAIHQAIQSAQIVDGKTVQGMRFVRDKVAPSDMREAREALDRMLMNAFRKALEEEGKAVEAQRELEGLRKYVQEALKGLEDARKEFSSEKAYLTARHTVEEFGSLAQLQVLMSFDSKEAYARPLHATKWYEYLPFLGRLMGPYSSLYKTVYGIFGLFAGVGSYISYYGYAWFFGQGELGQDSQTASGFGGVTSAFFTLFFMDQLGRAAANVVSSGMGNNAALTVEEIDRTDISSKSLSDRIGRTVTDGAGLVAAGFKTLFKTASAAVGAGNLYGCCSDAQINTQMPGIVALAASNGGADHLVTGVRLQQAISRFQEWRHGSGAQSFKDYIARVREAVADMNNEDVLLLHQALEEFQDLVQRLLRDQDSQETGEDVFAKEESSGEAKEPLKFSRQGELGEEDLAAQSNPFAAQASGFASRPDSKKETARMDMSALGQLREPLIRGEDAHSDQGFKAKVRAMVSAVWSKVTGFLEEEDSDSNL